VPVLFQINSSQNKSQGHGHFLMTITEQNKQAEIDPAECSLDQFSFMSNLVQATFRMIYWMPADIIDQVWPEAEYGYLNGHFKSKYSGYCIKEGYASPNAILRFFSELDTSNTRLFCSFIARNHQKHLSTT
jgi:hypothetical protein